MARIGLDLSWMRTGKVGGAEQVAHGLVRGLAVLDRTSDYTLWCPRATYWDWNLPPSFKHNAAWSDRVVAERECRRAALLRRPPLPHTLAGLDLLHAPSGYLPEGVETNRLVVTIHDLQQLHMPEFFTPAELDYRAAQLERIVSRANHILCISAFTRDDVQQRLGIAPDRLSVAWPSVDPNLATPPSSRLRASLRRLLKLDGPYAFYPAHPWPHKNHLRLLAAWDSLAGRLPPGWKLVLTGAPIPSNHPAREQLDRLQARDVVRHLGYRSPLEMRVLLHEATFLVFPSEFEGFGLPVVEAQLAGVPIACSNAGSLPEIAGDAALYFSPKSEISMRDAILQLATDPARRTALIAAGRARHRMFDPLGFPHGALAAYSRALGRPVPAEKPPEPIRLNITPLHHEAFQHWARRAESAGRAGLPARMVGQALLAALFAPIRAIRRFGGAALCHFEVFLLKSFQR